MENLVIPRTSIEKAPLAIAQLIRRAVNAKSSADRHLSAYYACEATLKLAAAARFGALLEAGVEADSPIAEQLEFFLLPSLGHWLATLRDISSLLAAQDIQPLGALDEELSHRRTSLLAVDAFLAAALENSAISADIARQARKNGVLGFFSALVAYRNEVLGHGAQRSEAATEKLGKLLLRAAVEILQEHSLLGDFQLAVARLVIHGDGNSSRIGWKLLQGLGGIMRPDAGEAEATLDANCQPGQVYLIGPGVRIPLHPLLVFREDELGREQLGFLNKTIRRSRRKEEEKIEEIRRVDYLDYVSGETLKGLDARQYVATMLERIHGHQLDSKALDSAIQRTIFECPDPVEDQITEGTVIGDYELEGEIGRGGMGIVYRARHISLNRIVALKVLPPAMASDAVTVYRFRREIAALARCDHPNVVHILASGVDNDRWWYAMELIDGTDLGTVYELLRAWTGAGASLEGTHISAAVSSSSDYRFSRQKLLEDSQAAIQAGSPLPELEQIPAPPPPEIDHSGPNFFLSLAELISGACEGVQHLHEHGIIHRDIKPSNLMLTSDGKRIVVMDLGLAQLQDATRQLTAGTIDILGTLRYMAPEQLQRNLLDVDHRADIYALGATLYEFAGLKPLYEAETQQELIALKLQQDPVRPREANPAIPIDLAAVIEKAIQRKPIDRYATTQDLAEDLRNVAEKRPVSARSFGRFHYFKLFVERNRRLVATIAASMALLLIILSGATVWNLRERHKAEIEARKAQEISSFLVGLFEVADPMDPRGNDVRVREILDEGARQIENGLQSEPEVRTMLLHTIGRLYRRLGLYEQAQPLLEEALSKSIVLHGEQSVEVAACLEDKALLDQGLGHLEPAENSLRKALKINENLYDSDDIHVTTVLHNLASVLEKQARYAEAEKLSRRALRIREKILGEDNPDTAESLNSLGSLAFEQGRLKEAEKLLLRSLEIKRKTLGPEHLKTAWTENNLANLYMASGHPEKARPLYEHALAIRESALGAEHARVGSTLTALGRALMASHEPEDAMAAFTRALNIFEKSLGPENLELASVLDAIAVLRCREHDFDEGGSLFKRSLRIREKNLGEQNPTVAASLNNLAKVYRVQGKLDDAEKMLNRALEILENSLGPEHPNVATALVNLASIKQARGELQESEGLYRRALEIREKVFGKDNTKVTATREAHEAVLEECRRKGLSLP